MNENERQQLLSTFDQFEEELREDMLKSYGTRDMDRDAVDVVLENLLGRSATVGERPLSIIVEEGQSPLSAEVVQGAQRYLDKCLRKLIRIIKRHGAQQADGSVAITMGELELVAPEFESLEGVLETAIENGLILRTSPPLQQERQEEQVIPADETLILVVSVLPDSTLCNYTAAQLRKSTRGRRRQRQKIQTSSRPAQAEGVELRSQSFSEVQRRQKQQQKQKQAKGSSFGSADQNATLRLRDISVRERPETMYEMDERDLLHRETFGNSSTIHVKEQLLEEDTGRSPLKQPQPKSKSNRSNGEQALGETLRGADGSATEVPMRQAADFSRHTLRRSDERPARKGLNRRSTISITTPTATEDALDLWHKHSSTVGRNGVSLEDAMATLFNEIKLEDVIEVESGTIEKYGTLVWGRGSNNSTAKTNSGSREGTLGSFAADGTSTIKKKHRSVSLAALSQRYPDTDVTARPELDVQWDLFEVPELGNFLRIIEAEELLHERQVVAVYNAKRMRLEKQLALLREKVDAAGADDDDCVVVDGQEVASQIEEEFGVAQDDNGDEDDDDVDVVDVDDIFDYDDDTMVIVKKGARAVPRSHGVATSSAQESPSSPVVDSGSHDDDGDMGSGTLRQRSHVIGMKEGKQLARLSMRRRDNLDRAAVEKVITTLSGLGEESVVDSHGKLPVADRAALGRWMKGQLVQLIALIQAVGVSETKESHIAQRGAPVAPLGRIALENEKTKQVENLTGLLAEAKARGIVYYEISGELTLPHDAGISVILLKSSVGSGGVTLKGLKNSVRKKKSKYVESLV